MEINLPKISVVTVCRNASGMIKETIESVVRQTYPHVEYIVIDGASEDDTLEQLEPYHQYISTLVSEPDKGIFDAMNKALKLITGDIVYFLNSGDRLASEYIFETVVSCFRQNPEANIVYGDYWAWYSATDKKIIRQPAALNSWQLWLKAVCHQTLFVCRDLFKLVGDFDVSLSVSADWDWLDRAVILYQEKALHIPVLICYYRMGGVSSNRRKLLGERQQMHKKYYKQFYYQSYLVGEFIIKVLARLKQFDFQLPHSKG